MVKSIKVVTSVEVKFTKLIQYKTHDQVNKYIL